MLLIYEVPRVLMLCYQNRVLCKTNIMHNEYSIMLTLCFRVVYSTGEGRKHSAAAVRLRGQIWSSSRPPSGRRLGFRGKPAFRLFEFRGFAQSCVRSLVRSLNSYVRSFIVHQVFVYPFLFLRG